MIDLSHFPELPKSPIKWAPVYFEPILGSGERLTVALAARDPQGEVRVVQTISAATAKCILGDNAGRFLKLIGMAVEDMRALDWSSLSDATPDMSLTGFTLGPFRETFADDLATALRLAVRQHAFLAESPEIVHDDEKDEAHEVEDRWPTQIRHALLKDRPEFHDYFNRTFRIHEKARATRIHFVGSVYAANFSRLIPGRPLSRYVKDAKVRLWDLGALRSTTTRDDEELFGTIGQYELILWRPDEDDLAYSRKEIDQLDEALFELQEEGDAKDLSVFNVHSAREAARRIVRFESAIS